MHDNEIDQLQYWGRIANLEADNNILKARVFELEKENDTLRIKVRDLEAEIYNYKMEKYSLQTSRKM